MIEFVKTDKNAQSSSRTEQKQANAYGEYSEEEEPYEEEYVAPIVKAPKSHLSKQRISIRYAKFRYNVLVRSRSGCST